MSAGADLRLTIGELAEAAGMTVRNVRNHRSRGLIGPPALEARTGYYGAEHLERLKLIRAMQAEGFNLEAIRCLLGGGRGRAGGPGRGAGGPLRRLAGGGPPCRGRRARGRRAVRPGARGAVSAARPARAAAHAGRVAGDGRPARPRSSSRRSRAAPGAQLRRIHEDVAHLAPELRAAGLLAGEAFRRLAAFDRHHEEMSEDAGAVERSRRCARTRAGRRAAASPPAALAAL